MRLSSRRIVVPVAVALLVAGFGIAGCGGSTNKAAHAGKTATANAAAADSSIVASTWSTPNGNTYNTRNVASPIDSANVSKLKVAWKIPLTSLGAGPSGTYASSPVFGPDGTVYFQDLSQRVFAVDGATGKVLWKDSFLPKGGQIIQGPNGLTLSNGVVYGVDLTQAFAVNASTGKVLWKSPKLTPPGKGIGIDIPAQVANGKVYVATGAEKHGGLLYGLNASNGKILWRFHTTVGAATKTPTFFDIGTGGAWNPPAVGPNGDVYFGTGNPYQTIAQAISHPLRILYNDSTVALNGDTGKLNWYYQANPDDFHDWDIQLSPIYMQSGVGGQPTILDGSKDGRVYAFNASTGKLDWQTPVGKHNGHDNDDLLAFEHKLKMFKFPTKSYPSLQAGVETNMAVADGVVYAPVVDLYSIYQNSGKSYPESQPPLAGTGDIVALNIANGKILWDHKLRYSPYGDVTVTNDLVFATTFSGQLFAFNRSNGKIVWQSKLPAGSIAPVAINGNMLITGAGLPLAKGEKPAIVAYELPGGTSTTGTGSTTAPTTPAAG